MFCAVLSVAEADSCTWPCAMEEGQLCEILAAL